MACCLVSRGDTNHAGSVVARNRKGLRKRAAIAAGEAGESRASLVVNSTSRMA